MKKAICIYHGGCVDGFAAAWAVWRSAGDTFEYVPASYDTPPPDTDGRHVLIVDFSYKRDVLIRMAAGSLSLRVLDHHKTAAEDLCGFPEPLPFLSAAYDTGWPAWASNEERRVETLFDMARSGAGLAWDFCHDTPRPQLINHVEDRDLWRFDMPFTREVHAAITSYPQEFAVWDELSVRCEMGGLSTEGAAILRKHDRDVATLLSLTRTRTIILGHDVPVANMPPTMASDAGNIMAQGEYFAATYYDAEDGRHYSLRSTSAGADVSAIAKHYGGGGHRNASGFLLPHGASLS